MARKNHPDPTKANGQAKKQKPWEALGISASTYYRRRKAGTLEAPAVVKPEPKRKAKAAEKDGPIKWTQIYPAPEPKKAQNSSKARKAGSKTVGEDKTQQRQELSSANEGNSAKTVGLNGADVATNGQAEVKAKTISNDEKPWLFKPGNNANPKGRPKGSRNLITQAILNEMFADFVEFGREAIIKTRETKPEAYLAAIVKLIPQQIEVGEAGAFTDMDDSEVDAFIATAQAELHQYAGSVH